MPTRNAGPRTCAKTCRETLGEAVADLGDDSELGGSHGPGGPSSAMTCRRAGIGRERVEGVGERGFGEDGGLFGRARRTQSRFDPAGLR